VGGDLNGDGYVGGVDAGQFLGALGTHVGDSGYLPAADILGTGTVSDCDQHVLEADMGFTPTRPLLVPGVLTLGLASGSDTAPAGAGQTTLGVVTLTGTAAPFSTVTLTQTGATAGPNGMFAFFNVALQQGVNAFTATATDASGHPLQATINVTLLAPVIT